MVLEEVAALAKPNISFNYFIFKQSNNLMWENCPRPGAKRAGNSFFSVSSLLSLMIITDKGMLSSVRIVLINSNYLRNGARKVCPLRPVLPILLCVQLDDQLVGDVFSSKAGLLLIVLPFLELLQSEPWPPGSGWIFLLLGKSYIRGGPWDSSRLQIT